MKSFAGKTLRWNWNDGGVELTLDPQPGNEMGASPLHGAERLAGVRQFLQRIHAVLNAIDAAPFVTIAAVHGICFGGGLELALVCDMIVADKMARFAFPELRLGVGPGL